MIHFNVSLVVEGPFLTRDSSASVQGVDAAPLRSADGGFLVPDTLVKGRLADAWLDLEEQLDMADAGPRANAGNHVTISRELLLGVGADWNKKRQSGDPHGERGRLRFSDLSSPPTSNAARQVRVELDELRLAASDQMLVEMESVGAPGERITFSGTLDADLPEEDAENTRRAVEAGLRWITAIGGLTGVGFGSVLEAHVTRAAPAASVAPPASTGDSIELTLHADRALCVMGHTPVYQNIFESLDHVPGNVLKGALAATALRRAGLHGHYVLTEDVLRRHGVTDAPLLALARQLSVLRVRHALPGTAAGMRPRAVPRSLMKVTTPAGVRETFDAALLKGPVLIDGVAPKFFPDWKPDDERCERRRFGWANLMRSPRVRTSINRDKRRAEDGDLFTHERVQLAKEADAWRSVVDLAAVVDSEERSQVAAAVSAILADGIGPIGKSKAFIRPKSGAFVHSPPDSALAEVEQLLDDRGQPVWVLVLQTEALLGSPATFAAEGAFAMYRDAVAALSGGALGLKQMFAQQHLCGGAWLHEKFRQPRELPYSPYLLTRGGSVFVLEATGEQAAEEIRMWRRFGMPLDSEALAFYSIDTTEPLWTQCPFLPQNGYGEVVVNQRWHQERRPLSVREVVAI